MSIQAGTTSWRIRVTFGIGSTGYLVRTTKGAVSFRTKPGGGLSRGFISWNSQVGGRSYGVLTFLYEYVCGNHRIWGVANVQEKRVIHIGDAATRASGGLEAALVSYAAASAREDEARIRAAEQLVLGKSQEEVVDFLFDKRITTRSLAAQAASLAEDRTEWYGDPRSAWGIAGAMTEIARDLDHADERVGIERSAGKLMDLAL